MRIFTNRITTTTSYFFRNNLSTISSKFTGALSSIKGNLAIDSNDFKQKFRNSTSKEKISTNINNIFNNIRLGAGNSFSTVNKTHHTRLNQSAGTYNNKFQHKGLKVTVAIDLSEHPENKNNPNPNPHLHPDLDKNTYENLNYVAFR